MRAGQTIARLAAFTGRGPGTDAERRAALWLAGELRSSGLAPRIETFWCRPNWALAHAWHAALALAGSLVATKDARVGLGLAAVALVSTVADSIAGVSLGRWLTPQRASQNVVVTGAGPADVPRLIVTANYDAGRTGLVYGRAATAIRRTLRRATGGRAPGWLAWFTLAQAVVAITAALRLHGTGSSTAGALVVVPTIGLVLALALLLEAAAAAPGPAANDNGSGAALAVALAKAITPRHLAVDLVLTGAHEGGAIGLRRYLRTARPQRARTTVLGLAASGAGEPRYWRSDGPLLPHAGKLRPPDALPHRGRGWGPAYAAYARHIRALTLGALDPSGIAPRSHRPDDEPDAIEPGTPDRVLELALHVVDVLDAQATTPR